jgi:pyruvate,water dikinase
VVRSLDEAKALQPGEILVTTTTMPAWTPLFGTAAAVVTETGGALSHCAVVAREYGVPAAVGVSGATRRITAGQIITVDGTSGLVTIETG